MHIKTTVTYHYTSIRVAKIQDTDSTKCWWVLWSNRNSHTLLVGMQSDTATLEESLMVSPKLNTLVPYNPAVKLLGIYPKELKSYVHTETCTWMFIAALFITAKTWKQPRCSSVYEWINKWWYIQTMEYYSALKRKELSSHEKTWRNLKCILLSEKKSQSANLKRLHTVWFQQYDILEKAELWK